MNSKRTSTLLAILLCAASATNAYASGAPTSQFGFSGWPYRQSTNCDTAGSVQGCAENHSQCTGNYCASVNCNSPTSCSNNACPSSQSCGQTQSATATPRPTATPTATPMETPLPTPTLSPGVCPPIQTAQPTDKPETTTLPKPDATAIPTQTPSEEATAMPTVSVTPAPTATPTVSVTPAPTATPSARPTATPTPAPTASVTPTPTATSTPSTGGDYTTPSVTAQEQIAFQLVNQDRQNNGRSALTLDPALCSLARLKSQDMNDNNYFAHTSPTLGSAAQMLKTYGYSFASVGENIAHHATVEKSQAAFMSSTGHRTNILGTQWTKVGIGVVYDRQGFVYVTQLFVR